MAFLEHRQNKSGGMVRGWGRDRSADLGEEDPWAVKYYLDAAQLRVRIAFADSWRDLPARIDPDDGRMQEVRHWFGALSGAPRVADVGCGTGRFLRHLVRWYPGAELTGIDFCTEALAELPHQVAGCEGTLLRIDVNDGSFDGAYAVESLEHSLVPQQAVAELCRIVRPKGQVLIIDKHRARQALSEHEPWERWFLPEELARWLGQHCRDVEVRPIPHSEGQPGRNLFLAASGTRR
jgi:SAM-dependent methyltransferase